MRSSSLLRLLPVFFLCLPGIACAQEMPPEEEPVDESVVYIFEDTTWTKDSEFTFDRPVMVNGATLTIEEGVKVRFTKNNLGYEPGMLQVQSGRIIAQGTEAKPIVFDRLNSDDFYWIDFYSGLDENPSVFRYVQFLHGGTAEEILGGGDMTVSPGLPALKYQEGLLRVENSLWKGSLSADVKVEYPYHWGDYPSYLHIVNSNFAYDQSIAEDNPANVIEIESWPNVAVDATGSSCPSGRTCQPTVTLKNNYYGDIRGPKGDVSNPDAFLRYGKRILGYAEYAGYRNTALIADPLLVIPGILGSQQNSAGEWVIDPILHAYDDFISSLKKNGYEEGKNLFVFPYDWYRKNEDTAGLLQQKIETIQEQTGSDKVDIAAHSMGGLVARAYAEMGDQAKYIDQLITIGTPHRGAPVAYLRWEAGEGFLDLNEKILKHHFTQEAEESGYADIYGLIRQKIPSVGQLLSIDNYIFDTVANSLRTYSDDYPRNEFLEQLVANETRLDVIRKKVAIVGDTGSTTISRIRVTDTTDGEKWQHGKPENFGDKDTDQGLENSFGDQTVPLGSARALSGAEQITLNAKHSDLPEAAQCDIFKELSGKATCLESHVTDIPNILLLNLFSPIDVQVISPSGKKIGKNFETGEIYDEIPGAFYSGYHTQNEFITIPNPEEGEYRILTQGTGTGPYRIEITHLKEESQSEAIESTVTITGEAESGVETEAQVEVADDQVALVGDNQDTTPPVTSLFLSGTQGTNGWYTSDVTVTLTAIDNENGSGIEKTEYSLDNGTNWNTYINPVTISTEGTITIQYRSTDKAGNVEAAKTEIIKIDTMSPEITVTFDQMAKDVVWKATDDQDANPSLVVTSAEVKATDKAGNMIVIPFMKYRESDTRLKVQFEKVVYNTEEISVPKTTLVYDWKLKKGLLTDLDTELRLKDKSRLKSEYRKQKNETRIIEKDKQERTKTVTTKPGLASISVEMKRGDIIWGY